MMNNSDNKDFRSGYVALIGRPNVGKSTLLNSILGEKVAIVTPRPQTTRNRIIGIKTLPDAQIIFMDTPGIHQPKNRLGEAMIKTAVDSLDEVDIVLFMAEVRGPGKSEHMIMNFMRDMSTPVFLLINKIDEVKKQELLPVIEKYKEFHSFREIIPISALTQDGVDILMNRICEYLPHGPQFYSDDLVTDQLERFMAAEIIREKIMELTEEEIPHSVAVQVNTWKEREDGLVSINCNIFVERDGQKAIIIGKDGSMLKSIGTKARIDIEKLLNAKVFLELWVKVKKNWRNDNRLLRELGYL
jgi:GTP-binding protein Era